MSHPKSLSNDPASAVDSPNDAPARDNAEPASATLLANPDRKPAVQLTPKP